MRKSQSKLRTVEEFFVLSARTKDAVNTKPLPMTPFMGIAIEELKTYRARFLSLVLSIKNTAKAQHLSRE